MPLWTITVDFKKAFDTVNHLCIWTALAEQGVPHTYIDVLRRLYTGQTGKVKCDRLSKAFDIQRGTRQGDPISPVLFNACLEHIMRKLKKKWLSKSWGLQVGRSEPLLNLRFADDLLLIGRSGQDHVGGFNS